MARFTTGAEPRALRAPAQVSNAKVADVDVGVAVRSPEPVSLSGVDVSAASIGVRVDRRSEAQLADSRVEAPQPYKGTEQITKGGNTRVKTLAPPGLHWFGVGGFAFLIVALVLEGVRRLRARGRDVTVQNAGVPGYSTDQAYAYFVRDGAALASKSLLERLDASDAAALGIDPDTMTYTTIAELPNAGAKAIRDAGTVAVTDVATHSQPA